VEGTFYSLSRAVNLSTTETRRGHSGKEDIEAPGMREVFWRHGGGGKGGEE
jgi:hypothetical protein